MKALGVLCAAALSGGCGVMDGMSFGGSGTLDPTKVYLASMEEVRTSKREVDQFDCLGDMPLVCTTRSVGMDCHCPW